MSGTRISQLPGAITPSATDLFPIVQSDVGPITRAITLAALRLAVFTNNTQANFGLNNTSTATNETAGFTVDIGGARRSNITTQRIGVTPEARLGFSISDAAGVLQEIVSVGSTQTTSNRPLRVLADSANITLALNGRVTSNDASIRFYNNAGVTEQARVTAEPNLLSLRVGANTPLTMSSTQINLLTTTVAATPAVNTNTTQLATTAFVVGQASTVAPLVNGTATVGSSLRYAREGHVHPRDHLLPTSKVSTRTGVWSSAGYSPGHVNETAFEVDLPVGTRSIFATGVIQAATVGTEARGAYGIALVNDAGVTQTSTEMLLVLRVASNEHGVGPTVFCWDGAATPTGWKLRYFFRKTSEATSNQIIYLYQGRALVVTE